jgi:magnesium transporter
MNTNHSLLILPDDKACKTKSFEISDVQNGYIWHHFFRPSEDELKALPEVYGLNSLSIEDCMDDDQIPKIESFANYTHILFNTFHDEGNGWSAEEINIFISKSFLISVTRSEALNSVIAKMAERIATSDSGNWRSGPSWLLHLLLDKIVDEKMIALEVLEDELEALEGNLIINSSSLDFQRIQKLRNSFVSLRKSLFHEREILSKIIRNDTDFIDSNSLYLFRDINDHAIRLFEQAESCRDATKSLIELHLAMANNQMAIAANNTNKTVRRLTFITTIFMPLTLIAGIGGMSEFTMMTGIENWQKSYSILMVILTIMGLLSYFWLNRMDREK